MSKHQVIQQLNRIIKMLLQQTLPNKEVLNSKEAALNRKLSPNYICILAGRLLFPSSSPNGGKRIYKRRDLHNWLLSSDRLISSPTSEEEKMAILNPERG